MLRGVSTTLALAALLAGAASLSAPADAAEYFSGKTVTILVANKPSSGLDRHAQILKPYMAKHIPGNPTVIVKHMPGAAGQKAQNFVYEKARRDGTTVMLGGYQPLAQITNQPGIRSKYAEFGYVGGLGSIWLVLLRKDVVDDYKSGADIVRAKLVKFGGRGGANPVDVIGRLALTVLGVKHRYISGFRGSRDVALAVRRGELDMQAASIAAYKAVYEKTMDPKQTVIPFYFPIAGADGELLRNAGMAKLAPYYLDVYKETHGGKMPSGIAWEALKWVLTVQFKASIALLTTPETPRQALADLQAGFEGATKDAKWIGFYKKRGAPFIATYARDAKKSIASLGDTDPKLVAYFKKFLEAGAR